jgi:hypothetical protein
MAGRAPTTSPAIAGPAHAVTVAPAVHRRGGDALVAVMVIALVQVCLVLLFARSSSRATPHDLPIGIYAPWRWGQKGVTVYTRYRGEPGGCAGARRGPAGGPGQGATGWGA